MSKIGKHYPGVEKYETAGFVRWQGHKDQNPDYVSHDELNVVKLIKLNP